jgi:hypothetical protein
MNEPLRVITVDVESLRLTVRAIRPSDVGTFLPVEAQPSEILIDRLFMFTSRTFLIRIFDSKDVCTVVLLREEPREQTSARISDME